jgi:ribonuclease BN (tRNA processing enzyme)
MLTASSTTNRMEPWTGPLSSAAPRHSTMIWRRFTLADILFHEAYSFDPKTNPYDAKAPVTTEYMNAFHTSTEQLAGVLKKVNPKLTVLYRY